MSKIPTVFQAGFLCAQLAASQLTNDGPERVSALGRLTMAYTIGMVIGEQNNGEFRVYCDRKTYYLLMKNNHLRQIFTSFFQFPRKRVLGPSVGGYLGASGDYYFAAKLSALGSLLSVALTMLMPDIHVAKVKKADEDSDPVIGSMEPKNNGVIGNVVKVRAAVVAPLHFFYKNLQAISLTPSEILLFLIQRRTWFNISLSTLFR